MNDWLVVLSEGNREICAGEGLLGLGAHAERPLNRMADGNQVLVSPSRKYVDHHVPWVRELRASARVVGPVRHLELSTE